MKNNRPYPMLTGKLDYDRLSLINSLYNPVTRDFLKENGLKRGMKVLEIGCGIGHMAAWLAQEVGPNGQVIAVDISPEQLTLSRKTAELSGVNNIQFLELDIREVDTIKEKFDLIFGRAVIEFIPGKREIVFDKLYQLLMPNGILVYESVSASNPANFSYPRQEILDDYFLMNKNFFLNSAMVADFPSELYGICQKLGLEDISLKINQPVLSNAIDKSVIRLGVLSTRKTVCEKLSENSYNDLIEKLKKIEQDDSIIVGYFRSLLTRGKK